MIDIRFEKLYRYPRMQEPCHVTIPVKAGELANADGICIYQEGKRVPVQTKVLSRHRDGSIRYLFARFPADLPANAGAVLQCDLHGKVSGDVREDLHGKVSRNVREDLHGEGSGDVRENLHGEVSRDICAAVEGIVCTEEAGGYSVDCGLLKFSVKNESDGLFCFFEDGGRTYREEQFKGPYLTEGEDGLYSVRFGTWQLVERGPVCAVLTVQALCVGGRNLICDCKVTAYYGKPWIEISFMLKNTTAEPLHVGAFTFSVDGLSSTDGMPSVGKGESGGGAQGKAEEGRLIRTTGTSELEELEQELEIGSVRTCVGTSNYKTRFTMADHGRALTQTVDADFLMKEGTEHFAEVIYGTFFADRTDAEGGICATVYQAHQNYPKAVRADADGIQVMLVPQGVDKVVMEAGMGREQRFQLHFHKPEETLTKINNRSLIYQMPDRALIAPEIYDVSGVMPDIFAVNKEYDVEAYFITRCDSHARCFGMLNWGDSPDPGYTAQGRALGELVWTNNEYDYPHACILLYARTGQRRFLDYALAAGSHWKDVDVCHYSEDPLLLGGHWEHTGGHVKDGSIVCSHEWVEGLIDCWHFTGDEAYLSTAIGIGENVLRLLETPMYQKSGEISARETGWALRTLTALYTETKEERWTIKSRWIIGQFKEWSDRFGHWLSPYTDNVMIRVPFMISVAVGSLMRYYQEFPSRDIKEMILGAVDDMVENSLFDNGYFYYKEIPSLTRLGNNTLTLEALTIAYQLTGNTDYLRHGRKTFELNLKTPPDYILFPKKVVKDAVVYGEQAVKDFAQSFLPMAVYYKAVTDHRMLPWEKQEKC